MKCVEFSLNHFFMKYYKRISYAKFQKYRNDLKLSA